MKRKHGIWGLPEENAFRETLRFFELYRFDTSDDYYDHVLRQRYIWLWEKGLMEMELDKEQMKAMVEVVQKMAEQQHKCEECSEGDECDSEANKEMIEKLKEINKPTKDKMRYVT